jgi:hypothetical protein
VGPNTAHLANPWLVQARLVAVNEAVAAWRFAGSASSDPHCLAASRPTAVPGPAASGNE